MTQNGLKWILNITLKTMEIFIFDPPPTVKNFTDFFSSFFEGFPNRHLINFIHPTIVKVKQNTGVYFTNYRKYPCHFSSRQASIQSLQMSRNIKLQPALVAPARLKPPALMSDISELGPGLGAGLRGSETSEEKFMQTESERKYSVLWKS